MRTMGLLLASVASCIVPGAHAAPSAPTPCQRTHANVLVLSTYPDCRTQRQDALRAALRRLRTERASPAAAPRPARPLRQRRCDARSCQRTEPYVFDYLGVEARRIDRELGAAAR